MTMTLTDAICLAARAHDGQVDLGGHVYIRHCLRVMEALAPSEEAMIVAVLHDVLEDTQEPIPEESLGWAQYQALKLLTRNPDETYEDYIVRICNDATAAGKLARKIKRADLLDNIGRSEELQDRRKQMLLRSRYEAALGVIG